MVKKTYLIERTNDKVTMTSINENAALDAKRQFELIYEVSLTEVVNNKEMELTKCH